MTLCKTHLTLLPQPEKPVRILTGWELNYDEVIRFKTPLLAAPGLI